MNEFLEKANKKQEELFGQISNSTEIKNQRPLFHFATPGGWCNDPNGFSQYGDEVHLFYQYHPYSTQWGPMHWGHVVSKDMLSWKLKPVALAPDTTADYEGCFSGTALEDNGKHLIAYTGVSKNPTLTDANIQNQCIAVGDGTNYQKLTENPVITAKNIPFEFQITDFRDPKIWKKDGKFYMACVLKQQNECGAMVMFESEDIHKWTYKGIIDSSKDGISKMWECPDVSVIDGKDCLIFSPQEIVENAELGFHNGNNSVYITGALDYKNCKFIRDTRPENGYTAALVDYGIDFYAPETTKLKDGRTIMIGWMQAWESYITPINYIWSGMMTLPRELSIKNNRLYQLPIRELENWKKEKTAVSIKQNEDNTVFKNKERHFEVDFNMESGTEGKLDFVLCSGEEFVLLSLNMNEQTISFDRSKIKIPGAIPNRKTKLRTVNKSFNVKIICDTCSLEVFLDDGVMAFTNTFFFTNNTSDLIIKNTTSQLIECDFYNISENR